MRIRMFVLLSFCLVLFSATLFQIKVPLKNRSARYARVQEPSGVSASAKASVIEAYGKLPLSFEANEGQSSSDVKFHSRTNGYSLFLTPSEAILSLNQRRENLPG